MRRQVQMIGTAVPVTEVEIVWHGSRVFSGSINDRPQLGCIASWPTDTSLWGNIDIEITVRRGEITWVDIHMNYAGIYLPLPGSESSGAVKIAPRDFYAAPNRVPDGKLNVCLDGAPVEIHRTPETQGPWHYIITAGQQLQAQYRVDRRCVVLHDPMC